MNIVGPILVVTSMAWLVSRFYDLRRIDDPFVTTFAFTSVLWIVGIGFGETFPTATQVLPGTAALLIGGYVALVAGGIAMAVFRNRRNVKWSASTLVVAPHSDALPTRLAMRLALGLGYGMVAVFVIVSGGVPLLSENGEQSRVDARAGIGYLVIAAIWLITLPTAALVADAYKSGSGSRVRSWLLVIASSLALAVLGNRAPVVVLVLAAGWVALTARGKLPTWRLLAAGTVAVVIALAVFATLRSGADLSWELVLGRLRWQLYVNTSNFEMLTRFIPADTPYMFGRGYLLDLAVLLPGPQPNFSTWLKDAMGLEFAGGGITIGLVGEFYANWGPAVAVAATAGTGAVLSQVRPNLAVSRPLDAAFVVLLALALGAIAQSGIVSVLLYQVIPLSLAYVCLRATARTHIPNALANRLTNQLENQP